MAKKFNRNYIVAGQQRIDGPDVTEAEAAEHNKAQKFEDDATRTKYSYKELGAAFRAGAENAYLLNDAQLFIEAFEKMAGGLISERE